MAWQFSDTAARRALMLALSFGVPPNSFFSFKSWQYLVPCAYIVVFVNWIAHAMYSTTKGMVNNYTMSKKATAL